MSEVYYIISDAAKMLGLEPYMLRHWEEELNFEIQRNEKGYRYYTEENIKLLHMIKEMKDKGFQMKAIKQVMNDMERILSLDEVSLRRLRDELNQKIEDKNNAAMTVHNKVPGTNGAEMTLHKKSAVVNASDEKLIQFRHIMKEIVGEALRENGKELTKDVSSQISERVLKEMDYQIRDQEDKDEERFRRLDEAIREIQKSRQEVAATETKHEKTKRGLFGKRKNRPR